MTFELQAEHYSRQEMQDDPTWMLLEVCVPRIFCQDIIDTWQYEAHLQHMKVSLWVCVPPVELCVFLGTIRQVVPKRLFRHWCGRQEHSLEKADDDE